MRTTFALAMIVVSASALSQTFFDDFNRPDGPLGANYTTLSGTQSITSNAVTGANGAGLTLVNASAFTGAYDQTIVSGDVRLLDTTSTLSYIALSLGSNGTTLASNGIYVKLQRQVAGGFSHIGFYTGAGSNTAAITTAGGNFQALTSSFSAARLTIKTTSPTNLYTGIDTNFDNVDDITYNSTLNFPTLVVGNRVGFHVWGNTGTLDNFRATTVPEPATMAALGLGIAAVIRRRRNRA
jgi:hypothetical protein